MSGDRARARLRELSERYGLGAHSEEQLRRLLGALERDRTAPTTIREAARAVDAHVADSLVALEFDVVRQAGAIADIGSGSGFPGVALAAALPGARVRLVESRRGRWAYLEALCAAGELANARAVCARAEEWREGLGANEVVVARALGPQPVVLEYAAPLLRRGGALVDWRGRRDGRGEEAAVRAAEELGLQRAEVRRVVPFADARERHLHLYVKVTDTPEAYPRRPGVALRRPLGQVVKGSG
jgi:16S rRNA (guanine527-N7)-methyltransferase